MVLRRILSSAASQFDATVGAAMLARSERDAGATDTERMPHEARLAFLSEMAAVYGETEWLTHPERFFPAPTAVPMSVSRVRSTAGAQPGAVLDATWTSEFEPWCADVREEYLSHEQNRIAAARLFFRRPGIPWKDAEEFQEPALARPRLNRLGLLHQRFGKLHKPLAQFGSRGHLAALRDRVVNTAVVIGKALANGHAQQVFNLRRGNHRSLLGSVQEH